MSDDIELPEPAFKLRWIDGQYKVSEPRIGNTDVYTADQLRAAVLADRERRAPGAEALLTALKDIAEWTERWTTPGHPVATIARKAIATHQTKGDGK